MTAPFNAAAFPGEVVDWAVITDWDLMVADRAIVSRVETWARVAVSLHHATYLICMRDDLGHRYIYVATREDPFK